jgi:hypothetical protein
VIRRAVLLGALLIAGCDDTSVAFCTGDLCGVATQPLADAGVSQTVDAGALVVLDGSNSRGGGAPIASYAWTQTGGVTVTLTDADQVQAAFVAPDVAAQQTLSFRLTIVNTLGAADSDGASVTVLPIAPAVVAIALLDGPLRPATPDPVDPAGCPSATDALPGDVVAAQLGLWLAARALALAKGLDDGDPSDWLDLVRRLIAADSAWPDGLAGQLQSFGYLLLENTLRERDPALQQAIEERLRDAPQLADPGGLLAGRMQVSDRVTLALAPTADPSQAADHAIGELLAARTHCVDDGAALALTAAALRVVAAAGADDAR